MWSNCSFSLLTGCINDAGTVKNAIQFVILGLYKRLCITSDVSLWHPSNISHDIECSLGVLRLGEENIPPLSLKICLQDKLFMVALITI